MKQFYISLNKSITETRNILSNFKLDIITGVYKDISEVTAVIDITNNTNTNDILELGKVYNQECILECEIVASGSQFYNVLDYNNANLELLKSHGIDGYSITRDKIIAISDTKLTNDVIRCNSKLLYCNAI